MPQVVVPIFSFDQVVNGDHVASVGAGLTVAMRPGAVEQAVAQVPKLLSDPSYAESARRVAAAIRELPRPAAAVPVLAGLAR